MPPDFRETVNNLDEDQFQLLYGRWDPLEPAAVDSLLAGRGIRWHIAGGRAARLGAAPRRHEDTDVVVRMADLEGLRDALTGWHLWETSHGALRPLLPGMAPSAGCEQLWARRDASQPWQLDLLLDRASDDIEWVFKRDASVRLPWAEALRAVAASRTSGRRSRSCTKHGSTVRRTAPISRLPGLTRPIVRGWPKRSTNLATMTGRGASVRTANVVSADWSARGQCLVPPPPA
jgi:hypothetical protein